MVRQPPGERATELLVVAGEASGDLYAARLLTALRGHVPGALHAFGLGGEHLAAEGFDAVANNSEISVVGLAEVLRVWRRAKRIFDQLLAEAERRKPAVAVLVDFPEFNLRLAPELARRGVRVVYYISPQLWAWRKGRVKTVARAVDTLLVLFPFEVDFYRRHGVSALHVGHPLVDEVPHLTHRWDGPAPAPDEPRRLVLLPGSRRSEVARLLPAMIGAVEALSRDVPVSVRLLRAPTIERSALEAQVAAAGVPIEIVEGGDAGRFAVLADAHLALCASGTATLETGLVGTPMLVLYRVGMITGLMARLLVDLPHFSLVNLVLDRPAVP
ncbi:MAG: lipid-A-disaccharide synthase, partial [Thermoanaerobaculia bacterium]|nr:lipid-A-disaccharide synthase [Thermoanaerobaculia bacterium]